MDMELNGKVALVTGASRGIGRAIAEGQVVDGGQSRAIRLSFGERGLKHPSRAIMATSTLDSRLGPSSSSKDAHIEQV